MTDRSEAVADTGGDIWGSGSFFFVGAPTIYRFLTPKSDNLLIIVYFQANCIYNKGTKMQMEVSLL